MKKTLLQIICIILFFSFFGYFYGDTYWDYQKQQISIGEFQKQNETLNHNLSLQEIEDFGSDAELFITPDLKLLDTIVEQMNTAQKKIYIEVYIFTEKRMRNALIEAKKRGVDVKVLLENNPYQAPNLNDDTYEILEEAGIEVQWSDPLEYSLNHSKLLIIDDLVYVSTGNFSYSMFKSNRDFLFSFSKKNIVEQFEKLFLLDFRHESGGVLYPNIVLSPSNSRQKIEYLLKSATETIDFYFPYLQDEGLETILFEQAKAGVKIRGIVEKDFFDTNPEIIERFKQQNIELHYLKKDKLHGKIIVIDNAYMYLGSINFSKYSMDENREMGLFIKDIGIIQKIEAQFKNDF